MVELTEMNKNDVSKVKFNKQVMKLVEVYSEGEGQPVLLKYIPEEISEDLLGKHEVRFEVENHWGQVNTYQVMIELQGGTFKQKEGDGVNLFHGSGAIKKIDAFGLATVVFNESMRVPEDLSDINST